MGFGTQFDEHKHRYTQSGSRKKKMYSPVFDDNGRFHLEESGEADLYDEIQSFKESVDINVLLQRYKDGDSLALERAQSMYGDFTNVPTTYSGMLNSMLKSKSIFESLPLEIRGRFDHSFEQFLSAMDDPELFARLVAVKDATEPEVKPDSKEDPAE